MIITQHFLIFYVMQKRHTKKLRDVTFDFIYLTLPMTMYQSEYQSIKFKAQIKLHSAYWIILQQNLNFIKILAFPHLFIVLDKIKFIENSS